MKAAPGIHSITQIKGGHVSSYLLDDGEGLTLIDALFDHDGRLVLAEIEAMGRKVTDLKHIILTHGHRSHIGGMAALKKASGAAVCSHAWEVDILAARRKATRVSPIPKLPWGAYPLQLGLALGIGWHVPCEVDRVLKAGDLVGPLQVVPTPGHTPGSLSFWWPERRALFVGDVIVTWPRLEPGWRGLTLDYEGNRRSAEQLTDFGNAEIMGVGHGGPIVGDAAAQLRELLR